MEPGKWIRALREERLIKPSDVERVTRTVAATKENNDFYVSHSTLADIEAGSIPSIHKLFSLAICLKVRLDELLFAFGIDPEEVTAQTESTPDALPLQPNTSRAPVFRFQLNFDTSFSALETTLLRLRSQDLQNLPPFFQGRLDPLRYRYAVIGSGDDSMAELIPPRSLVEVDTTQNTVQIFAWRTLRDRPIYLVWHNGGHSCVWCQVDARELTIVPHPLSHRPIRRFRMPGEATVVGRVTNAWLPFQSGQLPRDAASWVR